MFICPENMLSALTRECYIFIFDNFNRILIVHFMHYAIVSTTSQQTFRISWKAYTGNIEWLCIMTYLFIVHVLHCKQVLVVLC